ncbi:MAG: Tm-1-like ATP-binding domain-containing protein [Phycisphaerae bacterium]|nr:Tm-1-like ATP-binding domain-containing protein [Phycisphaerae bacterium]
MSKTILLIGAFDVKGVEYAFVRELIERQGCGVRTMNVGVMGGTDLFPIDVDAERVAEAGGGDLKRLREAHDRGASLDVMSRGAAVVASKEYAEGRFDGVLAMGGSGGTGVACAAMRALPIGVPKVMVSTIAASDTSALVGVKDVVMIPSIVDVAGVNRISEKVFREAVGAVCGMVGMDYASTVEARPIIAATMFGNTTPCVDRCREALTSRGYEVLVFHCTGSGGRTMEGLVGEGYVEGVLDITTTEWADEVCGGVFSAGDTRLDAPGKRGVPHLIVPGCVDMANFGGAEMIPERYKGRVLNHWSPTVTLMRTSVDENARMGEVFARKANASRGPVAFLLPLRGVSMLDKEGEAFWDPEADGAMFEAIRKHVRAGIEVAELDCNINDAGFADKAVEMLLGMMGRAAGA